MNVAAALVSCLCGEVQDPDRDNLVVFLFFFFLVGVFCRALVPGIYVGI